MPKLRKVKHRAPPAIWPWRTDNSFELLEAHARYLQRLVAAIDAARYYLLLEMYLMQSGFVTERFVEALVRAAARGVGVHLLIDGFGASGLAEADRERLRSAGVQLCIFNPIRLRRRLHNFLRDHRKLMLVDGEVAFVGGIGLTDEFGMSGPAGWPWRDLLVEIHGPVVADWQEAFTRTWMRSGGGPLPPAPPATTGAGTARGRVVLSEAVYRSELAQAVVRRIELAQQRAWIMSAYFVPSRRFRKALRGAARRGLDVRLLVPGPLTDHPWVRQAARRFYDKLLRNGVRIFEYQPRVLHGKMIICDEWVSVGSSNLDRWSFKWNLEANQEVEDAGFAACAAAIFEQDCLDSQQLDHRHWPHRARLDRLQEHLAGTIDRWLDRWRRPDPP